MRIIIVGDGKVGYTLAEQLSKENHDLIIIDKNVEALRRASESLDVMCLKGSGASVSLLKEAGAAQADLLIAATTGDEMNMVCCLLGRKLGAEHTIARIRDPEYVNELDMLRSELGLAMVINPEEAAAQEIARLLRFPHADNIEVFARGRVEMVAFRIRKEDPIAGRSLAQNARLIPEGILFCAIEREGRLIIPHGDTRLMPDDIAHIVGQPATTTGFFKSLGRAGNRIRSVMIIGGGRITHYLAKILLAAGMEVKIIEIDPARADALNDELDDALVIAGDGTDQDLLQAEEVDRMDAFVALTDRDEENLMASLYAHSAGTGKVIVKINRLNYADIIHKMGIDSVISPKLLTADHIVRYVRALENTQGSPLESLFRIVDGKAEALEFEVGPVSRLTGRPLKDLPLAQGVLVAVIVRKNHITIPRGDTVIKPGDHVIAITHDRQIDDADDLLEA